MRRFGTLIATGAAFGMAACFIGPVEEETDTASDSTFDGTGITSQGTGETGNCPVGEEGCPCTAGGGCAAGLKCLSGFCVQDGSSTTDPSTTDPSTTDPSTTDPSTTDPSTTDPSTTTTDTGMGMCGDGEVDGDEECDDGDPIDGNGCNTDCTESAKLLWEKTWSGNDQLDDVGISVAVDSVDRIVVSGYTTVAGEGRNILALKYAPDGTQIWTRIVPSPADGEEGYGVAVDGADNIAISGTIEGAIGGKNIWLRKYDSDGQMLWTAEYDQGTESGRRVAVDSTDAFINCGHSAFGTDSDLFVGKWSTNGLAMWAELADIAGGDDEAHTCTVDLDNNTIVGGLFDLGGDKLFLRKYDKDAATEWTRVIDFGPGNIGLDGVAVNGNGEVFAAGWKPPTIAWLQKFGSDGTPMWSVDYDGEADLLARAHDVTIDGGGNVVVVGFEENESGTTDGFVSKYGPDGTHYWTRIQNGASDGDDGIRGVTVDSNDATIVVGLEYVEGESWNLWLAKYAL